MPRAAFLGRFQPLHRGHFQAIEAAREEFDRLVLVVGSADKKREEENPLSFEERKKLLEDCFPGIEVIPLEDTGRSEEGNREWVEKLEEELEERETELVISGNELVQQLVDDHTSLEIQTPELHEPGIYSGTEVRRRIRSGEEWRYLVPDCARESIEELLEPVKKSGIDYEFKPGWKKENINN